MSAINAQRTSRVTTAHKNDHCRDVASRAGFLDAGADTLAPRMRAEYMSADACSKPRSTWHRHATWSTLLMAAVFTQCNGCPGRTECDLPTPRVSARVVSSSITAPPGGTPSRSFEVKGAGFHPNAKSNLTIDGFPKAGGVISEQVTTDAAGSFRWTRNAPLLLPTDPDLEPNADVTTTVAEVSSTCFGLAKSSRREFSMQ